MGKALFEANSNNYNLEFVLANGYDSVADVYLAQKNPQAKSFYQKAETHYQKLLEKTKLPVFEENLQYVRDRLTELP